MANPLQHRSRVLIHWLAILASVAAIVVVVALFVVETPWAEERARRLIVSRATAALDAELVIDRLSGSLYGDTYLHGVTILRAGTPVIRAESIRVRYSPWALWRSGLIFNEVELIRPVVLLVEEPDGWNLARLLRARAPDAPPAEVAFGIRTLRLTDGSVEIRALNADPRRLADVALDTSLDYRDARLGLGVRRASLRDSDTGVTIRTMRAQLAFENQRLDVTDLSLTTAGSSLTGAVAVQLDQGLASLRADLSGDPVLTSELTPYVPALATLPADVALTFSARGTGTDLQTTWTAVSAAGRVVSSGTKVTLGADQTAAAGAVQVTGVDLAGWLDDPRWGSRIDASGTFDVQVPRADPRQAAVSFVVSAPAVTFAGYRARQVHADGRYVAGRLDANARGLAYGTTATARVTRTDDGHLTLSGRYGGANLKLLPADLAIPALDTAITGTYALSGGTSGWEALTTIESATIEGGSIAPGALATLDTRGPAVAYSFKGQVSAIDLGRIAPAIPAAADVLTRLGGPFSGTLAVDLRGTTLDTIAGRISVSAADSTISGIALARATVEAEVVDHRLVADVTADARGISDQTVGVTTAGSFEADGGGTVRLELADISAPLSVDTIRATARLAFARSRVGGIPLEAIELEGVLDGGVVTLGRGAISGGAITATADGRLVLSGSGNSDLRYRVDVADLTVLEPLVERRVTGRATTSGQITGPADRPVATGTTNASSVRSDALAFLSLDASYQVELPDRDVERLRVQSKGEASFIEVAGTRLDSVVGTAEYEGGGLVVDVRASEGTRAIDLAGELVPHPDHREVHVRRVTFTAGGSTWVLSPGTEATIEYSADRIGVRSLSLEAGRGRLVIDGALGGPADAPLRVTMEAVRLEDLEALWPSGRAVTGTVNGTALISGSTTAPVVTSDVWITDGAVDGVRFDRAGGKVQFGDRRFLVEIQLAAGPLGNLTAVGTIPFAFGAGDEPSPHAYDVSVQSTAIDLGFFQPLIPALDKLTGTGLFNVRLTGPATAPSLNGRVSLTGAGFLVVSTGVTYQRLVADLTVDEQRVVVDRLRVQDRDGHVATVQGELTVPGIGPPRGFDLRITSDNFRVLNNQFGDVSISAELQAMGDLETPLVSGTISVDRGRLEATNLLERLSARGYQAVVVTPSADVATAGSYDRASVSITLDLPDNVVVRGRDLRSGSGPLGLGDINVTVGGALSIAKETGEPLTLLGRLNVVRGQYQFQGRRFDIQRGSQLQWSGLPSNPSLDVEAQRVISGVTASVVLRGTLEKPEIGLSSDPPLDQGDVLSLIVFNQAMNQLPSEDRVSLAARASVIAVGAIATPLADSVARALDLDLFEIRPSETARGASIVMGRQINENLFVGFSQEFGVNEVSRVQFEYRLNEFLRIVTSFAQGGGRTDFARRAEAAGIDLIIIVR